MLSDQDGLRTPVHLPVSIHLLVLGAFRRLDWTWRAIVVTSQCTFWCLVLSDSTPRKQRHNAAYWSEIAADLESTTLDRLTPLQLNHTTAENRHKQPQRHRHPLPTSTPPASNKPKPKNHHLKVTYQKLF